MDDLMILMMVSIILSLAAVALTAAILIRNGAMEQRIVRKLLEGSKEEQRRLRMELNESVQRSVQGMGALIAENQKSAANAQLESLQRLERAMADMAAQMENRLKTSSVESEQKLENIRSTVEKRLSSIQEDNNKRLDEMRRIVDEKLQKTINDRMTESFRLVNERLEQVHKGLGEMQTLAVGVGDLKKALSNVKTRGILGEIQLGAILSDMLSPEQYVVNTATRRGSSDRVEFAIKLPADDGEHILLPIDSKFPMDAYNELMDAYDSGDRQRALEAAEGFKKRVRGFAKDIRDKYVDPPATTEFALMFLPTEGLYAEVVKLGVMERIQQEYHVNIAGPSIMAALLNSIQMGFKSVAIQKRSGEVWKVLSAVKTEFSRFEEVLSHTRKQLTKANEDLDKLIGVRTRQIRSRLNSVSTLPEAEARGYLEMGGAEPFAPDEGEGVLD